MFPTDCTMRNKSPAEYPALIAALQQQNPALAAHAVLAQSPDLHPSCPLPIQISRVQTYTHAYQARIIHAIAQDYPATQYLLGQNAFKALSLEYLKQCPPQHWDLNTYGVGLAAFMQSQNPWPDVAKDTWILACSVAQLESEITRIYWIPSCMPNPTIAEPNNAPTPNQATLESTVFNLCNTACLLQLHPKTNAFLNQFRQNLLDHPLAEESEWVLISRPQWSVQRAVLSHLEAKTLQAITGGLPFGEALNGLMLESTSLECISQHLSGWMNRWLTHGVLCNIHATSA